MDKTVVCLKWGTGPYTSEWVNRLYRGVCRHLSPPFRFVCFTDDTADLSPQIEARNINALSFSPVLTGIWWKLAVTHPKADLTGNCLFLDLDIIILDDLDVFFTHPGEFCMIHNWIEWRKTLFRRRPFIGNSSVFRFVAGREAQISEIFLSNPEQANRDFPTEQAFMTFAAGKDRVVWWPENWVRSYKRHCLRNFPLNWIMRPKIPKGTRILAFHGRPKPDEAIRGYCHRPHKSALPLPLLAKHWQ